MKRRHFEPSILIGSQQPQQTCCNGCNGSGEVWWRYFLNGVIDGFRGHRGVHPFLDQFISFSCSVWENCPNDKHWGSRSSSVKSWIRHCDIWIKNEHNERRHIHLHDFSLCEIPYWLQCSEISTCIKWLSQCVCIQKDCPQSLPIVYWYGINEFNGTK